MKYKIIACDMDETLLSSDATICRRNIEAITAAIAKGVKFVPCTGRGFRSIEGVLRTLGLYDQADQYVIGFNGANITENKGNRSLFWDPIPFDLADRIFRCCCPQRRRRSPCAVWRFRQTVRIWRGAALP